MDAITIWYWVSSLGLAALLYRPTKKVILVQRFKRTAAKLKRQLTEEELKDLEKKPNHNKGKPDVLARLCTGFSISCHIEDNN